MDGDIARVKRAWLSLLCPAQHLKIDKDAKNGPGGLVLGAGSPLVDIQSTGCRALGAARD